MPVVKPTATENAARKTRDRQEAARRQFLSTLARDGEMGDRVPVVNYLATSKIFDDANSSHQEFDANGNEVLTEKEYSSNLRAFYGYKPTFEQITRTHGTTYLTADGEVKRGITSGDLSLFFEDKFKGKYMLESGTPYSTFKDAFFVNLDRPKPIKKIMKPANQDIGVQASAGMSAY